MARYSFIFLIVLSIFITGCPAKPQLLYLTLYNDCDDTIVLYNPSGAKQGKILKEKESAVDIYSLTIAYHLSADEYDRKVKEFLTNTDYVITAKLPNGEEVHFTLKDILEKGDWPGSTVVNYYICKGSKKNE